MSKYNSDNQNVLLAIDVLRAVSTSISQFFQNLKF